MDKELLESRGEKRVDLSISVWVFLTSVMSILTLIPFLVQEFKKVSLKDPDL